MPVSGEIGFVDLNSIVLFSQKKSSVAIWRKMSELNLITSWWTVIDKSKHVGNGIQSNDFKYKTFVIDEKFPLRTWHHM